MNPHTLKIRFDDLGRVEACGDISPFAAMTSLCPNCNHLVSDHHHPSKRCNQCDKIASWFVIDRMAQRNNTIEIYIEPGQHSDGYTLVSTHCSIGCSEMHSYEPGCALYKPTIRNSKVSVSVPHTQPPLSVEQAQEVLNKFRGQYGSMLQALGRLMEPDQQGLETPEERSDSSPGLTLDDRISQLEEHVHSLLAERGQLSLDKRVHDLEQDNKQMATELEHVAKELWHLRDETVPRWTTRVLNQAGAIERLQVARDNMIARQDQIDSQIRVNQEDADQNIVKVREEMRELETQLKSWMGWMGEYARDHVDKKIAGRFELIEDQMVRPDWAEGQNDRVRKLEQTIGELQTRLPVGIDGGSLNERIARLERAMGDVVRTENLAGYDRRISRIERAMSKLMDEAELESPW